MQSFKIKGLNIPEPPRFEAWMTEIGGETIISGLVSGTLDGSPPELHHHLAVTDGRVAALTIKAENGHGDG